MKKITYIFLILLVSISQKTKSQTYFPFPETNAQWTVQYETQSCMGNYSDYQYSITGDTTINSLVYHKINVAGSYICGSPSIFGVFRNDLTSKKVYFMHSDSISESLLYDFNLTQGDTIKGYLEEVSNTVLGYNNVCVIDSVDSVLINGSYRNRWNYHSTSSLYDFSNSNNPSYIEGIGNTFGLFEGLQRFLNLRTELVCHAKNGTNLYGASQCNPLSINNFEVLEPLIYPNPFKDKINFVNAKIEEIVIINIVGEVQLQTTDIKQDEIDLSFLPEGIYFIKVKTRNSIFSNKLIKKL